MFQYRVRKSEKGGRLDRFLYDRLSNFSHKKIKQAIDDKRVIVNGKKVFIASWNLKDGDQVSFLSEVPDKSGERGLWNPYIDVLYEDECILVASKAAFVDYDSYVIQINAYLRRRFIKQAHPYVGQMHRLDRETSGVIVFTKKKSANVLADQFRQRQIKKIYLAVVDGSIKESHGIITKKLLKGHFDGGKKAQVGVEGRESYTEYWVMERYENATLLKIMIKTGRTHQIRVHFSEMGYPVKGDKIYGKPSARGPIKRLALHSYEMTFKHPLTGKVLKITAPPPQDFEKLLEYLRASP